MPQLRRLGGLPIHPLLLQKDNSRVTKMTFQAAIYKPAVHQK